MSGDRAARPEDELRCPICGAELADIAFDLAKDGEPSQEPQSRELTTYRCGHQVVGSSLATADEERLDVERRTSDETVDPS